MHSGVKTAKGASAAKEPASPPIPPPAMVKTYSFRVGNTMVPVQHGEVVATSPEQAKQIVAAWLTANLTVKEQPIREG